MLAIELKTCEAKAPEIRYAARPKKNVVTAGVRRVVLESRHYFVRANVYHWGFQGVRWSASSMKNAYRK
mgnify:CR=1 FL=1